MTIWDDLLSSYKSANLETIFLSLGISGIPESDYSGLKVASLAQWILESARGTSLLATRHFNFGGLKWRDEMTDFATKVLYEEAHDGPDYYCRFASLEAFITGYWKFITRSPYTGWEDQTSSPEEYIEFIGEIYAPNQGYVGKVKNLFAEARQLLALSDASPPPQGTWIQETDEAIYWMKGQYYIDKVDKVPDDDAFAVVITDLKEWFSGNQYPAPQSMKIAKGDVDEPSPIPEENLQEEEDPVTPSVTIVQPRNGDEFDVNEAFTVEGTADEGVKTVNLYTSWGGTNFELKTSIPVVNGKWSARIPDGFNTGGQRDILAEGNYADGNSDFYPYEVTIQIGTGMVKPTRGDRLSSPFGPRNGRMHNGVDIAANRGVPIFAVADGVVSVVQTGCSEGNNRCGGGYGNHVYIKHAALELETRYAHMTRVTISNGERVSRGQTIGTIGSTGNSTGPHLHFEIRQNGVAKNPLDFINPIV